MYWKETGTGLSKKKFYVITETSDVYSTDPRSKFADWPRCPVNPDKHDGGFGLKLVDREHGILQCHGYGHHVRLTPPFEIVMVSMEEIK